jgi:hypothetical protein
MPRESAVRQLLCANIDGFSLHAAVRVDVHDRKRLEQLCRYVTRPALSDERVHLNDAGQVALKLKTPWRDGTTHLVMIPLEFMQRLAALVPRPRLHLIRFHGVPARNAKLRPLVVSQGPEVQEQATDVAVASECEAETVQVRSHRISWARLLKRVCDIDMQHCPNCGGAEPRIIAPVLMLIGRQADGPKRLLMAERCHRSSVVLTDCSVAKAEAAPRLRPGLRVSDSAIDKSCYQYLTRRMIWLRRDKQRPETSADLARWIRNNCARPCGPRTPRSRSSRRSSTRSLSSGRLSSRWVRRTLTSLGAEDPLFRPQERF